MPSGFRSRNRGATGPGARPRPVSRAPVRRRGRRSVPDDACPAAARGLWRRSLSATPSSETSTLAYFNRPIVVLKASVLGRSPMERAAGAERALDDLVAQQVTGPVASQVFEGGALISVGSRVVFGLTSADIDSLSGETIQGVVRPDGCASAAGPRRGGGSAKARRAPSLRRGRVRGIDHRPGSAVGDRAGPPDGGTKAGRRGREDGREVDDRRCRTAARDAPHRLRASAAHGLEGVPRPHRRLRRSHDRLRQFPYTRPWGESLRGFLLLTVQNLGLGMVEALPGLFTVALIF